MFNDVTALIVITPWKRYVQTSKAVYKRTFVGFPPSTLSPLHSRTSLKIPNYQIRNLEYVRPLLLAIRRHLAPDTSTVARAAEETSKKGEKGDHCAVG